MRFVGTAGALAACLALALSACSGSDETDSGPEEFTVLPSKPLERPRDYQNLPTPGAGESRTKPDPQADAVKALGGNPNLLRKEETQSSRLEQKSKPPQSPIVRAASRFGFEENIREIMAEEDSQYQKDHGSLLLSYISKEASSVRTYGAMILDPSAEAEKLRSGGIEVPEPEPVETASAKN